jgi:hypothetical protein
LPLFLLPQIASFAFVDYGRTHHVKNDFLPSIWMDDWESGVNVAFHRLLNCHQCPHPHDRDDGPSLWAKNQIDAEFVEAASRLKDFEGAK